MTVADSSDRTIAAEGNLKNGKGYALSVPATEALRFPPASEPAL
jgi:hypothetical protein